MLPFGFEISNVPVDGSSQVFVAPFVVGGEGIGVAEPLFQSLAALLAWMDPLGFCSTVCRGGRAVRGGRTPLSEFLVRLLNLDCFCFFIEAGQQLQAASSYSGAESELMDCVLRTECYSCRARL